MGTGQWLTFDNCVRSAEPSVFALTEDEVETAQEYLMGMRQEVLALFTAHCMTIILQIAMLSDYDVGDFRGTS